MPDDDLKWHNMRVDCMDYSTEFDFMVLGGFASFYKDGGKCGGLAPHCPGQTCSDETFQCPADESDSKGLLILADHRSNADNYTNRKHFLIQSKQLDNSIRPKVVALSVVQS